MDRAFSPRRGARYKPRALPWAGIERAFGAEIGLLWVHLRNTALVILFLESRLFALESRLFALESRLFALAGE